MNERVAVGPPLPVLLDAHALSSVATGGGVRTYVRQLLAALARREDVAVYALCAPDVVLPDGVTRVTVRRSMTSPRLAARENALRLPLDLRRRRPPGAVFHNPSFHAPAGVRPPWVQTLLDVIPLVDDSPDLNVLRRRWRRFGPRYAQADAVIAISSHAANEGIRLLGLDGRRVHVAHLGVDPTFTRGAGPVDPPYLLVVGEYSRRKGFDRAFAVIDGLVDAGYPHRLVVAGRIHPWARAELETLRHGARHSERIELLGAVPDLVPLYQGATALLMPSRVEGFGLAALEAMACGVPVIAFDNSSLTEVVGAGGCLVPDGDTAAMTAAVRRVLDSAECAAEWRQRGLEQATHFTWDECAARHTEVYRSVVDR
jgi:alpha-1,3-rhamnosyl/mannosyltransferase